MTEREVDDNMRAEMNSLVAAYVLDALPADERAEFEAYLNEDPAQAREVAELSAVSALLGATNAAEPPSGLRERVLLAATQTRQLPPITRRSDDATGRQRNAGAPGPVAVTSAAQSSAAQSSAAQSSAVVLPDPARPVPLERTRRQRVATRVATAFALAAVLVLGVVVGIQADRLGDARRETQLAREALAFQEVTRQADMRTETSRVSSGGNATVLVSDSAGRGVVLLVGVDDLTADRTYQLWLIDAAGAPRPVRTFLTDDTTATVDFADFRAGDSVGVSVEPAGGSPTGAPTTTPVLALKVA